MEELGEKMVNLFPDSHRLKDGINLNELVEKMATEFTLDCSNGEYEEPIREQAIDKLHDFDDYEPHLNWDPFDSMNNSQTRDLPFQELKEKMTPVTQDRKVLKMILRHGAGEEIPPKAMVYCHYNAYFELEEVPFDSSYLRQQNPERFQMGVGSMFTGFELSLATMRKGEKSRFLVEPCYAFGKLGAPPRIPPNAGVLLEIELIKVVDCGDSMEDDEMYDKIGLTFEEYYKSAKANHLLGNDFFQSNNIAAALDKYKKAEKNLLKCSMNNDNEEDKYCKLLLKIYVNMCICYNHPKVHAPQKVCVTAREAFHVCRSQAHNSPKLLFNLAKAQMSLSDFNKAKKNLSLALKLEPHNTEINKLLKQVDGKRKQILQEEKITYQRALGLKDNDKEESVTDIPDDDFEKELLEGLQEFAAGDLSRLDFPPGFTNKEIAICNKVCQKLHLNFHDQLLSGRRSLYITK